MAYPINVNSLLAGIKADLKETWRQVVPTWEKEQATLFKRLPASNLRNASYVFKESLPFPSLWPYGMGRKEQSFMDRKIDVGYWPYELSITWNGFNAQDDQLGDFKSHTSSCINRYKALPYTLAMEYFNGTAVELPYLGLTFDGASLFSSTDGDGNNRLGVSGGNLLTGSGCTPEGVMNDLAAVQRQFMSFVDPTAGKPIYDGATADYLKMIVIVPKEMNYILQKLSEAEYIKVDPSNNTSESNYFKGKIQFQINQLLTDTSDWYVVLEHEFYKPFVVRDMAELESFDQNPQNSDKARQTNEYGIYTHTRFGMAPFFPGSIIKVNN